MKFDLGFEEEVMGSIHKFDQIYGHKEICCFYSVG